MCAHLLACKLCMSGALKRWTQCHGTACLWPQIVLHACGATQRHHCAKAYIVVHKLLDAILAPCNIAHATNALTHAYQKYSCTKRAYNLTWTCRAFGTLCPAATRAMKSWPSLCELACTLKADILPALRSCNELQVLTLIVEPGLMGMAQLMLMLWFKTAVAPGMLPSLRCLCLAFAADEAWDCALTYADTAHLSRLLIDLNIHPTTSMCLFQTGAELGASAEQAGQLNLALPGIAAHAWQMGTQLQVLSFESFLQAWEL